MFYAVSNPTLAAEPLPVFVSIAPQRYFVQQIGRGLVDVQILVEPGADPHTYEPKPQQMVALSKARLYFAVGVEFEAAKLKNITDLNSHMRVVHTEHGIMKLPMTVPLRIKWRLSGRWIWRSSAACALGGRMTSGC